MLREAGRSGPAAAVRTGEGAGRGPGRPGARAVAAFAPRCCSAGPGAGAGVCREAAAAAAGCVGGRRGAASPATCLRRRYTGEAERGPRRAAARLAPRACAFPE